MCHAYENEARFVAWAEARARVNELPVPGRKEPCEDPTTRAARVYAEPWF
jgi:hypothetical protein